jgi:probable addiction module antidote protein
MKKKTKKPAAVPHEPFLLSWLQGNPERCSAFLSEILLQGNDSEEDFEVFFSAIEKVLRAQGIADTAKKMGVARDTIYKTFRDHRNPTVKTFRSMINAMDMELAVVPKKRA